jgi:hypothetical protein
MPPRPFMLSLFLLAANVTVCPTGKVYAQDASWADKLCSKAPILCEGLPPDAIPWAPAQNDSGQSTDPGINARVRGSQSKIRGKSVPSSRAAGLSNAGVATRKAQASGGDAHGANGSRSYGKRDIRSPSRSKSLPSSL